MKKIFKIPCTWQMYGFYHIEANDLTEALQKAEDSDLPTDADYVDCSFVIDHDMIPFYDLTDKD